LIGSVYLLFFPLASQSPDDPLVGATRHPARFPGKLPEFFIKFLTDEGDEVLDIFAGSNTTEAAAEELNRRWLAFDLDQDYLAASALRFVEAYEARAVYNKLSARGTEEVDITGQMLEVLLERPSLFSSIIAQER
jgi:site-specific DNA-methyltransferase (cytosine-N4-specific)